jgi:hypothetical protein
VLMRCSFDCVGSEESAKNRARSWAVLPGSCMGYAIVPEPALALMQHHHALRCWYNGGAIVREGELE